MKHIFLYFSIFRSYYFLSLSFPVYFFLAFYFLSFSSVCFWIFSTFSFSYCLFLYLSSTFFLASFFLLSFFSDFFCLSSTFSFCFCLFLCLLLPSWLSSTFFLSLSSIISPLIFSLSFRVCVFYHYYHPILSVFSTFQFFLSAFSTYFSTYFFLFCFSYLVLFSTLFDYLVLILDFLLNIFPRFGGNAPVFLSLVSFSRIVVYILMETQSMAKFALISYGFLVFGNMLTTFFKSYQISQLFQRILPWLNSFMYISVFLNSKTYHNKCVYFSLFP